jgi:acetyl-CoA carboxylase biotin carboxyl carrier protein
MILPIFCHFLGRNQSFLNRKDSYLRPPYSTRPTSLKNQSMDFKQIQDLIKTINKSNISELSIEEKDFKITIRQKEDKLVTVAAPVAQTPSFQVLPAQAHTPTALAPAPAAVAPAAPAKDENLVTIKSPMIGTFYRRSSPDKPLFVEAGDEIQVGKVVCIIEAMKLFNEIESEVSGRIVKILVDDATPVEYDQPLFLVNPS